MKSSKPPRLATWLLEHFGPAPNNEPLAGDLLESFRLGRSRAWYWRQVLTAIRWWRYVLNVLLLAAGSALYLTWEPGPSHSLAARLLEIVVITAIFLALTGVGCVLSGPWKAVIFSMSIVVWLLLSTHDATATFAHRYDLVAVIGTSFLLGRKHPRPAFPMTYRELLHGDAQKERYRLISKMEQTVSEETDPEMRQVYAQAITVLQERDSRR